MRPCSLRGRRSYTRKLQGLGILSSHVAASLLVAGLWRSEFRSPRNDFTPRKRPLWHYWVLAPALLVFWEPVNHASWGPDFNPIYLLSSGAGLAFCMLTPAYLALLILCYPRVNLPLLQATSVIGVAYGLGNLFLAFYVGLGQFWWIGVLHLPLLVLSINGLVLSLRSPLNEDDHGRRASHRYSLQYPG